VTLYGSSSSLPPPRGHPRRPVGGLALANPKTERDVALDIFESEPELLAGRVGQTSWPIGATRPPSSNGASLNTASN
jgi:hypothetical protein